MGIGIILFAVLALFLLFQYHWKRRHLYKISMKLEGPPALPLVGNGLSFLHKQEDFLGVISKIISTYTGPTRFWLGPHLLLLFSHPEHVEKILLSTKLSHKHELYDFIKIYIGEGLVSSSGEKHKRYRKIIQRMINTKFILGNMDTFQKHINIFLEKLSSRCGKCTFDIHEAIHLCCADIIGETVLGMQMKAQYGQNMDFVHASAEVYTVAYERIMKPWYHPDIIYNFTSGKKKQSRIISISYNFIKRHITNAIERVRTAKEDKNGIRPLIDQIADVIDKDTSVMDETDFVYNMYTLYLASEDTLTIIIAMLCVCLGMYPQYQKRAAEEVRTLHANTSGTIAYDNLSGLPYLDMCIKDVLRLIPIAPLIARRANEDFAIDDYVIPKDCGIIVSIFDLHRNPKHWENPSHFHPDHFLPDAVNSRHPYAYIPFSAGPRSCVGKQLAYSSLKLIMVNILQRFEIEADGKFPDIVLRSDITTRSVSGYNVRLKERVWN
ncbi:hypothetical protein PPYR_08104 [Photinus pyralis]|uniref:Cytochrome P450 n=1 Tax=Photinus pyralis TaxID=7054 RepID=A0A5N4AIC7_PHOPY|nr:cytochrome P450 4C1-like [Photinus pyralis]KAB0797110.1 hypothetical protein PPYR_08104 [Photinus pyralis]